MTFLIAAYLITGKYQGKQLDVVITIIPLVSSLQILRTRQGHDWSKKRNMNTCYDIEHTLHQLPYIILPLRRAVQLPLNC